MGVTREYNRKTLNSPPKRVVPRIVYNVHIRPGIQIVFRFFLCTAPCKGSMLLRSARCARRVGKVFPTRIAHGRGKELCSKSCPRLARRVGKVFPTRIAHGRGKELCSKSCPRPARRVGKVFPTRFALKHANPYREICH